MNKITDITNRIVNDLNNQLDNQIIEGLARKGFKIDSRAELYQFAKNHCRCEDNINLKERIYYVNDTPFFLHNYNCEMGQIMTDNGEIKINATYGSFAFL